MADIIRNLFTNWIYLPFLSLLKFLASDIVWLVILIIAFFVITSIQTKISKRNTGENKIKSQILPKAINLATACIIILLLLVVWVRYETQIRDFFKVDTSTTPSNTTTTPGTTTTLKQTTPTYQAPKQLYYSIGCYNCWADGCPRNGYSYNGYDSASYTYYDNACHICDCSSINGRSFWK